MFCREWTLVKRNSGYVEGQPLKCRSWQCEHCNPERARQLIAQGLGGKPNKFLTLTVDPERGNSAAERARELVRAWRLLRLRAMRLNGWKKLPFLAVIEKTKRGEPHLHILLRCGYLSQRWLSEQMAELIGAPIVDIRTVRGRNKAAAYVAKYVGKDPHKFNGCKRYWCSQDWELKRWVRDEERWGQVPVWDIVKTDIDDWIDQQFSQGNYFEEHNNERYRFRRRKVPIQELLEYWIPRERERANAG